MSSQKYWEKEWYNHLKKKYNLCDDDMDEFIESFDSINKGNIVTSKIFSEFINGEIGENDRWNIKEGREVIKKINLEINGLEKYTLDLYTYIRYIIPICQVVTVNKINIRELFESIDTNQDDKISCEELVSVLYKIKNNFGPSDIENYKNEIKKLCKNEDKNQDGYINYEEFKNFINKINGSRHQ